MLTKVNHVAYAIDNLRRRPILVHDLREVLILPEVIVQGVMDGEYKKVVNNTVIFFNTFTTAAAVNLFLLLTDSRIHPLIKSIMHFIGVWDGEYDDKFYNTIMREVTA